MQLSRYAPAAPVITQLDRALGALFAPPAPPDEIGNVADAVAVSLTMAPTVVIVPPIASDADSSARESLLASFDRFAGEKRMKLIQLTGSEALGDQIEPAVSEFLRGRTAAAGVR